MRIKKYFNIFFVLPFFCLLFANCNLSSEDFTEYVNEEVSYEDGESCVERYLLFEEDGKYERYIAGMYFGKELPGVYFGTLFETGTYALSSNEGDSFQKITFSPKKQYDFDKKRIDYLGLKGQIPYYGKLTDTTLTITWEVKLSYFEKGEVKIIYTKK